jgi:hypothetical protein
MVNPDIVVDSGNGPIFVAIYNNGDEWHIKEGEPIARLIIHKVERVQINIHMSILDKKDVPNHLREQTLSRLKKATERGLESCALCNSQ